MLTFGHLGRMEQKKGETREGGRRIQSKVKPEQHIIGL